MVYSFFIKNWVGQKHIFALRGNIYIFLNIAINKIREEPLFKFSLLAIYQFYLILTITSRILLFY